MEVKIESILIVLLLVVILLEEDVITAFWVLLVRVVQHTILYREDIGIVLQLRVEILLAVGLMVEFVITLKIHPFWEDTITLFLDFVMLIL